MPTTSENAEPAVPRLAAKELATKIHGSVLCPWDDGYDIECRGFNRIAEHRPAVVVTATGAADVRHAVTFAAEHAMTVAVQATGHGIAAPALGGMLIRTRRMNEVGIDPAERVARVQAGVQWGQVVEAAAEYGLAPLNGSSPLVGVVGYTLGGGLGSLGREYGYAADHVRAIEVVTADGVPRKATSEVHADLFWGLRGGKGNFGVVTALEFDLVPVSRLFGGGLYFTGDRTGEVVAAWCDWTHTVPPELTSSLALLRLPAVPEIPELLRGKLMVHVRIAFTGPASAGESILRPLRALGPVHDTVADMPYTSVAGIHHDPTDPQSYTERSTMLRDLGCAGARDLVSLAGPDSGCVDVMVELRHLGGALGRPAESPNAVGNRDATFSLSTLTAPESDVDMPLVDRMTAWSTGRRYLNFLGGPATAHLTRDAYDVPTYARLADLKARYDPANTFRVNHNIPPLKAN